MGNEVAKGVDAILTMPHEWRQIPESYRAWLMVHLHATARSTLSAMLEMSIQIDQQLQHTGQKLQLVGQRPPGSEAVEVMRGQVQTLLSAAALLARADLGPMFDRNQFEKACAKAKTTLPNSKMYEDVLVEVTREIARELGFPPPPHE